MGQAKLRGTYEQRQAEGIIKEAARIERVRAERAAFLNSLTRKEKEALATIRTFAAFAGVSL